MRRFLWPLRRLTTELVPPLDATSKSGLDAISTVVERLQIVEHPDAHNKILTLIAEYGRLERRRRA